MTPSGESNLRAAYEAVRLEQLQQDGQSNADWIVALGIDIPEFRAMVDAVLGEIVKKNERERAQIEAAGADFQTQCLLDAVGVGFRIGNSFGSAGP
jgi:hypothetical protein